MKHLYRIVDFKRTKHDVPAKVSRLEYDPNRTAFIALIGYADGEQAYILAPQRLAVGDTVIAGAKADIKPGNAMPFNAMPIGTIVHNVEMKPGKGGQIARSAGTYAQFVGRDGGYAQIRLSSGELRLVRQECMATVGAVSNPDNSNQNIGKAGRNRLKGIRPSVRGVVMNPIDHPHGGGEGRTSGGRHPVTPWGKPTKGAKHALQQGDVEVRSSARATSGRRSRSGPVCHVQSGRAPSSTASAEEGGEGARVGPQRGDQDLVASLDDPAPVRGADLRRLQWQEAHPGQRQRGHDRPEVRRILADPYLSTGTAADKKAKRK